MEMSSNNPEKKKNALTDNCDNCSEDYDLTPDNTVVLHYTVDTKMDNLICHCPHCKYRTRIFIGKDTLDQAVSFGIQLNVNKYAHPTIVSDYEGLYGMKPVETYELTNRHEAIIHKFGKTVLAMPDQMLYDGFHDPTDKPYPLRWND